MRAAIIRTLGLGLAVLCLCAHADYDKSLEQLRLESESGIAESQYQLGLYYAEGRRVKKNAERGFDLIQSAAIKKYVPALDKLGEIYAYPASYDGVVKPDYRRAFELTMEALKADYTPAFVSMGYLYQMGFGVEKDPDKALSWFKKASDRGYARGTYAIAMFYDLINGTQERNVHKAVEWLELAAKQGYPEAQRRLAAHYDQGEGVEQDCRKGMELRETAAQADYAPAQLEMGNAFKEGRCVLLDLTKAKAWYQRACENGDSWACGEADSLDMAGF